MPKKKPAAPAAPAPVAAPEFPRVSALDPDRIELDGKGSSLVFSHARLRTFEKEAGPIVEVYYSGAGVRYSDLFTAAHAFGERSDVRVLPEADAGAFVREVGHGEFASGVVLMVRRCLVEMGLITDDEPDDDEPAGDEGNG